MSQTSLQVQDHASLIPSHRAVCQRCCTPLLYIARRTLPLQAEQLEAQRNTNYPSRNFHTHRHTHTHTHPPKRCLFPSPGVGVVQRPSVLGPALPLCSRVGGIWVFMNAALPQLKASPRTPGTSRPDPPVSLWQPSLLPAQEKSPCICLCVFPAARPSTICALALSPSLSLSLSLVVPRA